MGHLYMRSDCANLTEIQHYEREVFQARVRMRYGRLCIEAMQQDIELQKRCALYAIQRDDQRTASASLREAQELVLSVEYEKQQIEIDSSILREAAQQLEALKSA